MSLAMMIFSMIAAWMAVALAMLWGVLRIARRHQHADSEPVPRDTESERRPQQRQLRLAKA